MASCRIVAKAGPLRFSCIVVDLERREVVDVLPERSAQSSAQWFLQHPEVEIVSRDRCGLYDNPTTAKEGRDTGGGAKGKA